MNAGPSTPTASLDRLHQPAKSIRRFVGLFAALAAVLLVIWWARLLAPQLTVEVSDASFRLDIQQGMVTLAVTNDSPLPDRVVSVELDPPESSVMAATLDGAPLDRHPRLAGGGSSSLVVHYQGGGCARELTGSELLLVTVRVETVSGFTSSVGPVEGWSSEAPGC